MKSLLKTLPLAGALLLAGCQGFMTDQQSNSSPDNEKPDSNPLVLDVDTGRDDTWAILGALANYDVRAIVTTYGNVPHALTTDNTQDVMLLAEHLGNPATDPKDVVIWSGETQPLNPELPSAKIELIRRAALYGNGMAGLELPDYDVENLQGGTQDWEYLFAEYADKEELLDYVVCGPMTNLAEIVKAFGKDEEGNYIVRQHIGKVIAMGGSLEPDLAVDFNFKADPEAVRLVMEAFGEDLILVPYDETKKLRLNMDEIKLLQAGDLAAEFMQQLMVAHAQGWSKDLSILLHDPATLYAFEDEAIIRSEQVSVVLEGDRAGKLVPDENGFTVRRLVIPDGEENRIRDHILQRYMHLQAPSAGNQAQP